MQERAVVLPCVFTNSVATIAAELQDGSRIVGQNDISHPHQTPTNDPIAIFEGQPMLLVSFLQLIFVRVLLSSQYRETTMG